MGQKGTLPKTQKKHEESTPSMSQKPAISISPAHQTKRAVSEQSERERAHSISPWQRNRTGQFHTCNYYGKKERARAARTLHNLHHLTV